jgi:hypothetical protein
LAIVTGDAAPGDIREVRLSIRRMTCVAWLDKSLSAIADVTAAVNFATEKATVMAPLSVPLSVLTARLNKPGYDAECAAPEADGAAAAATTAQASSQGRARCDPEPALTVAGQGVRPCRG